MASVFQTYLQLGFLHICTPHAADHLTFLLALCAPYVLADWRRVLALVTSFTVGHSLTLALATLGLVAFKPAIIEALIPVTIIVTALWNLRGAGRLITRRAPMLAAAPNALALGFGLIHGLGFSNYLRALLGPDSRPVEELLAFNIGVELGQILIVSAILLVGAVLLGSLRVARRDWLLTTSGAALGIATVLLLQQLWP
ncbi:HupE/UreJ family protein [Microvirga sp. STS02]|uniref:HupE/UreJ family protein n=1 Tax=Hymenobacter negativus TaxID=2795026 RepID=UPI0018DB3A12|nr:MULTISPECIES: HupE/UreJ family protein [Bacteria]MBH8568108.1 HupE/UreJ family protein [Hymenobacter negativus]MBR7207843.1 HupE/UreJ family protein [Microvirga sp. STS02]